MAEQLPGALLFELSCVFTAEPQAVRQHRMQHHISRTITALSPQYEANVRLERALWPLIPLKHRIAPPTQRCLHADTYTLYADYGWAIKMNIAFARKVLMLSLKAAGSECHYGLAAEGE